MSDNDWKRNLVEGTFDGHKVLAHWDLSVDPVCAATLGLPWANPREPAKPDVPHTLIEALKISEWEEQRIAAMTAAIERAMDHLSSSFEEDSFSRSCEYVEMAYEALRRTL